MYRFGVPWARGGEQLQVPAPGNLVLTGISDRPHWDQTELALILTDEVAGVASSVNGSEIFNSSPASGRGPKP